MGSQLGITTPTRVAVTLHVFMARCEGVPKYFPVVTWGHGMKKVENDWE